MMMRMARAASWCSFAAPFLMLACTAASDGTMYRAEDLTIGADVPPPVKIFDGVRVDTPSGVEEPHTFDAMSFEAFLSARPGPMRPVVVQIESQLAESRSNPVGWPAPVVTTVTAVVIEDLCGSDTPGSVVTFTFTGGDVPTGRYEDEYTPHFAVGDIYLVLLSSRGEPPALYLVAGSLDTLGVGPGADFTDALSRPVPRPVVTARCGP